VSPPHAMNKSMCLVGEWPTRRRRAPIPTSGTKVYN